MFENTTVLFLTKLLPVFFYPLGSAIGLVLLGWIAARTGQRMLASWCTTLAISWLWIASTPSFADWALSTLEQQYPAQPIASLPQSDVAIVLGGAIGGVVAPRHTIDLTPSSDRVLHAARIFRAGKAKRILVTGGNIPWLPGNVPEAHLIRDLLVEWGVPATAVEIAGASRNTYENALEIQALQKRTPFTSALLVTSAAHMPRSMAIFRRAKLPVTPATTDVEVVTPGRWTLLRWLPQASALVRSTMAIKEWIGFWAYRARGYL